MQYSWRRLASETFRWQVPCFRQYNEPRIANNFFRQNIRLQIHRAFSAVAEADHIPSQIPPPAVQAINVKKAESEELPAVKHLTVAQVALEAARAVQIAVPQGDLGDAFHVLNSIHYANNKSPTLLMDKLNGIMTFKAFQREAIPFQEGTPIRLVAHSLLHSLVRERHLAEASRLAEQLMKQGIRIHWKTLDSVFESLTIPPPKPPLSIPKPRPELLTRNILNSPLRATDIHHAGGSFALNLLNVARQSRQRRTRNMFKTLITLCIINGEIIAASLLFGLLVKDWNARVLETAVETPPTENTGRPPPGTNRRKLYNRETAWPSEHRIVEILQAIEHHLNSGDSETVGHAAAMQALANLAALLDDRLIPFKAVEPLLRLLYHAQRHEGTVQVPDKRGDGVREVQASLYFQRVLDNLCNSLPRYQAKHASDHPPMKKNRGILPALDMPSYNRLLAFALHSRRSPVLADKILNHMTKARVSPLRPDAMTAEIYRRAAVLLRNEKLWWKASSLGGKVRKRKPGLSMGEDYASILSGNLNLTTDEYRRTIDFLVHNGHPKLVVPHVETILLLHEKEGSDRNGYWRCVGRVIKLGPRLIVSILNALEKAGCTAKAEEVWTLAREAERASWKHATLPAWSLPIEAYTIMLKVYGAEAKQGFILRRVKREDGTMGFERKEEGDHPAVGWGTPATSDPMKPRYFSRSYLGAKAAMLTYAMAMSASSSHPRKPQCGKLHKDHKHPVPDAIFFDAALDVMGRQWNMFPRSRRATHGRAKRCLRNAERQWDNTAILPRRPPHRPLLRVASDMVARGMPIPLGLRPFIVGHRIPYAKGGYPRKGRSLFKLRTRREQWRNVVNGRKPSARYCSLRK